MRATAVHSMDPDPAAAAEELIAAAQGNNPRDPALGILFVSESIAEPSPLPTRIRQEWPGVQLIGGSFDGEASSVAGCHHDSSLLVLLHDTNTRVTTGVCRDLSDGAEDAARAAWAGVANQLTGDEAFGLLFSDGLTASGDAVVEAMVRASDGAIPFFGGLTADRWPFKRTFQIHNDTVYEDAAAFGVLEGARFGYGVDSGWRALTPEVAVTEAAGNTVYRIGGQRALDWLHRYVDPPGFSLGQHPLVVRVPSRQEGDDLVLRAPITVDHGAGSLTFAGDVPSGASVCLATVRRDDIASAVRAAVGSAQQDYGLGREPAAALMFSCAARSRLLGTRCFWEVNTVVENLQGSAPVAGGYVLGEVAPRKGRDGAASRLHNQTVVVLYVGGGDD